MQIFEMLPWIAGGAFVAFMLARATGSLRPRRSWVLPAALSAAFLAWSIATVIIEGPLGFWAEHTRNMWGNQIWFDLLLAAGVAWFFLAERARAARMKLLPWLVLILTTGSIGLLAMVARLLYLEERDA